MSEVLRDLDEMGIIVKPKSYQNKVVEGNEDFWTKEIQNYVYTLVGMEDSKPLFVFEDTMSWALLEIWERVNPLARNPGEAYKLRKDMWDQFLVDGKFDYTYSDRLNQYGNLERVHQELVRNPDSRQAWLPIFFPEDIAYVGGKRRIPCSLGYYFMVREGKLNLTYVQRSADAVAHFGNDVFLAWQMMLYMAKMTGNAPGMLTHHIFSLHSYKRDWDSLNAGIAHLI